MRHKNQTTGYGKPLMAFKPSATATAAELKKRDGATFDGAVAAGNEARRRRACPKCGGKAVWHETTAYCTKSKCGWFEVVKSAPRRIWRGPFVHRYILTCHECGGSIVPGSEFFSDMVSGHIVRHVECHNRMEADGTAA